MADYVIIILAVLNVLQLIDRHLYSKDMTNKLNDSIKAIMSRNISEYLAATKPVPKDDIIQKDAEDIELSLADDETFQKHIESIK